ncbi:MAG: hypothetical protein R3E66_11850 [bacterium]
MTQVLQSAWDGIRLLRVAPHEAGESLEIAFSAARDAKRLSLLQPLEPLYEAHRERPW